MFGKDRARDTSRQPILPSNPRPNIPGISSFANSKTRINEAQWRSAKGAPTPPLAKPSGMPPSHTK